LAELARADLMLNMMGSSLGSLICSSLRKFLLWVRHLS